MTPIPTPMGWLRETQRLTDASIEKALTEEIEVQLFDGPRAAVVLNHSSDEPSRYEVPYDGGIVSSCTCPHYTYRDVICKHMVAVAIELEDRR